MEITVNQSQTNLGDLLDRVQQGEEVLILSQGQTIARLIPADKKENRLPNLSQFRNSLYLKGDPLSKTVIQARDWERY